MRCPPEVFAREVLPRWLAAPAELILDALPPLQPQTRFLEVAAGGAVVARALVERIAGLGRLVAVDADPALALALPSGPKKGARAVACFPNLPFAAGAFDVAIANMVLGDAVKDGPELGELHRVLRPGGWLLATVALRGSFDELFSLLAEACESSLLQQLRGRLQAAKAGLPDDETLRERLSAAGYVVAHVGIEDRLLCLVDGDTLLQDPLLSEGLVPALLGAPFPTEAKAALVRAANTWFKGGMPLRVRTAIITARVSKGR